MIVIRHVRKRFGAFLALDGVSTRIAEGAFVLLLGANGAGKTTLLRCILGLCGFDGTITVGGWDVATQGCRARALVGYVPQRPSLPPDLTCGEVLDLFARLRGRRHGDRAWLARVGLAAIEAAAVRTLSGGMRQRLALAVALQTDPPILLFDEPATSLDLASRRRLYRDLEDLTHRGCTVVLATHVAADLLQSARQALVLHQGRLIYEGPARGLGSAVHQRVVFAHNGTGREALQAALAALPEVEVVETPGALIATTPAGQAFDLLAALASAGVRPAEVQIEEPTIDLDRLCGPRRAPAS
jgi:ABC-type multidrug transport system ATPase subunit